jgi:hypothetical protein
MASIRYCRREGMKYNIGLEFEVAFGLSDPVRRTILERVLCEYAGARKDAL